MVGIFQGEITMMCRKNLNFIKRYVNGKKKKSKKCCVNGFEAFVK